MSTYRGISKEKYINIDMFVTLYVRKGNTSVYGHIDDNDKYYLVGLTSSLRELKICNGTEEECINALNKLLNKNNSQQVLF